MNMTVKAMVTQGKVQFTGSYTLKMTDFSVKPPTAMFGTIKTGDEITVKFNVDYVGSGAL